MKWFAFDSFQSHIIQCQKNSFEELQTISFDVKYESSEENKFKKVSL